MRASNWEFAARASIFGAIIGVSFGLYAVDRENIASWVGNWVGQQTRWNGDGVAQGLLFGATVALALAAFVRTWASSYLNATVVYASEVKSGWLVADGPYRRVRNPLYFANILMAVAFGSMMSRIGFVVCVVAMAAFCYRLILREEAELSGSQGAAYETYRRAVPRLWPAWKPRVPATGRKAAWGDGFKAEAWYWGFALALFAFAATLKPAAFFAVTTGSLVLFWISSYVMNRDGVKRR